MRKLVPSFAVLGAVLTGCINDDSLCPADVDGNDGMTIEFKVNTRDIVRYGSRTLLPPTGTPQDGTTAENYLDLRNTVFMLFDEGQTLIKLFIPEVTPEDETYATYSVRAFISADEFHTLTDGKTEVKFSIAVVGNYSGLDPRSCANHIGEKIEDIFDKSKVGTFSMPISNNWSNDWRPSIYPDLTNNAQQAGHIPMAGIQTYNVRVADLEASTVDHPLILSGNNGEKDINMLRALAKIEVIDNISSIIPDATGEISSIEKVELVGYNTRGSIFPTSDQWNSAANPYETQYVTKASIPDDNQYKGALPENDLTVVDESSLVNFFKTTNTDGENVFSCYLTEYTPVADTPMWIRITMHNPDNSSTFYRLYIAPYTENVPGAAMPILRNNIYRYEITGLSPELDLTLNVEPWNVSSTEWSYEQTPAMTTNGFLVWTGGSETPATAEVLYNSTTLVGTFAFDQPRGGSTWHANLIPANEYTQNDSFYFVDEEGNIMTELPSGVINGTEAVIRIAATTNTTEYNRAVRLVFTVNTFDGRTITANVLDPNEYGTNQYFTITQNAQ